MLTNSSQDIAPNLTEEFHFLVGAEALAFTRLFNEVHRVTNILEWILLWSGAVGNVLTLIILCTSCHMRTVSFAYHKCLMAAHLVYCLNFLVVKYSLMYHVVETIPSVAFDSYGLACYIGVVSRVVTSASGFLAMYITLAISTDRFLALLAFTKYAAFNRAPVASAWIVSSLVFSFLVNSWSPWIEKSVIERQRFPGSNDSSLMSYAIGKRDLDEKIMVAVHAKNVCNAIVRCGYLLTLLALTLAVISRFIRQRRRRSSMVRQNMTRRRRDHSLYFLMVAMLVLAYIQVVPREVRRVYELIYPELYLEEQIDNPKLSIGDRKSYVRLYFYIYILSTQITNLCTATERSLFFYLNIILNHNFRHEFVALFRRLFRLQNGNQTDGIERSTGWFSSSVFGSGNTVSFRRQRHQRSLSLSAAPSKRRPMLLSMNSNQSVL